MDGKALPSVARGRKQDEEQKANLPRRQDGQYDHRADPEADWGVKVKRGKRPDGSAYEKVTKWFGFELHMLVDCQHELPLNYEVTMVSAGESPKLIPMVEQTLELHPKMKEAAAEVSADKGYDSTENNVVLYDVLKIKPIIDRKADWKDPDETRPIDPKRVDTLVYDVKGKVSCICPETGEARPMSPWGFEADRGCREYRWPAAVGE